MMAYDHIVQSLQSGLFQTGLSSRNRTLGTFTLTDWQRYQDHSLGFVEKLIWWFCSSLPNTHDFVMVLMGFCNRNSNY